ncbi:MAG: sulfatase [Planctomycetota bacterium]
MIRRFLVITFLALTALFIDAPLLNADEDRPPNVVFILVDDLGWADVGCFGSSFYETPHIDALAQSGMKLTNAYAACQVCSPTRASILTGRYPQRLGITDYINPAGGNQPENWRRRTKMLPAPYRDHLELEEVTIAERLKAAGYATFFAGKWHLGVEGFFPEDQGFDVNMGGIERGGPYGGKKYFSPYGNERLSDGPEGEHLPDRLATETVNFMTENKDKPFLAYLSFYSVHTPLIGRPDLVEKYEEIKTRSTFPAEIWGEEGQRRVRLVQEHAVYAAMVEAMDAAVGKVTSAVEELGLADDTLIVFTSDNGGLSTSEGHPTSNLPLRAGKGWIYEGGIREPTIIRVPGITEPGSESSLTVSSVDYFPTILDFTGVDEMELDPNDNPAIATQRDVDGISILPLLQDPPAERDSPIFWHYPHYGNQGGSPSAAVLHGDWKLIHFLEDNSFELYNIAADISEQSNVLESNRAKALELRGYLATWQRDVGALFPTEREEEGSDSNEDSGE